MERKVLDKYIQAAAEIGITIGEKERNLFNLYCEELLVWNEKMNLVSVKTRDDIWMKHFIDSLTLLPLIKTPAGRLLDIGSGAGFPGIPIKIAMNTLEVFLLEASRKRVSFLKHLRRRLRLEGLHIIHKRVEDFVTDESHLHTFDIVVSRASLKLPELIRISSFFLVGNGRVIAMKGPEITKELKESAEAATAVGMVFHGSHDLKLPIMSANRKIVIYKRVLQSVNR
ncbi:MAG: 16S rRNA (guanine(527)-N(7))-methyltransferase RsmG [Deltaproteobacteria bacterium]|nr:16S rRNA (guanine(527)-N(7))-methyltransferase RsmG [Deltaproteobacteria bacterium]